jgi:hypothetical protein
VTGSDRVYRACLHELELHGLLPASYEAVYAGGSLVRGWGNDRSDLDIFVIVREPWRSESAQLDSVGLRPEAIPVESTFVSSRRWDVEYWLESQVDQLFDKVAPDQLDGSRPAGLHMTTTEIAFLERLAHAALIDKDEWVHERKRQLEASPVSEIMTLRALHMMDIFVEDAVGQLQAGEAESAVLSAKIAFGSAIEALLASHGEFGETSKWFVRRYRAVDPPELGFEDYWKLETMRSYDSAAPEKWVEEVVTVCQKIASEVKV